MLYVTPAFRGLWKAVRLKITALFTQRDVLIRNGSRARHLRLSPIVQASALFAAAFLLGVFSISTYQFIEDQIARYRGDLGLRLAAEAHRALLKDILHYADGAGGDTRDGAVGSGFANIPGSNADDTSDRTALRALLDRRAQVFEQDMRSLAAANAALREQLASLRTQAKLFDQERQASATRMANADAKMLDLEQQLKANQATNAALAGHLTQTEIDLAKASNERQALQSAQEQFLETIDTLKGRLASMQQSQTEFVANVTERTRNSLETIEKTIAMTGLKVDAVLAATSANSGQGGPFIPDPAPADHGAPDVDAQQLLQKVATLDDEVERWEKLQVVLHSLPLSAPIDHYYVSSGFGHRIDPIVGEGAVHQGLDLVGTLRSEVLSTAPGTVVFAGWRGNYGRVVEIDHGLGVHTLYAHLDSLDVKEGDTVDYRQVIGRLGNSGRSTGAHVHYEVRFQDRPLDPERFLKAGRYVFKG